jgi:LysM repeat protein
MEKKDPPLPPAVAREIIPDNKSVIINKEKEKDKKKDTEKMTEEKTEEKSEEKPCTYTVQAGDTLMAVSLKNSISLPALKKFNRLYGRNSLYTGQVLQLQDPALHPSTWTDSGSTSELILPTSATGTATGTGSPRSFTQLKDISDKQVSFLEKERLKAKSQSFRNLALSPPPSSSSSSFTHQQGDVADSMPPTLPPLLLKKTPSSSFKYKCNSNPDLKSMADLTPSSSSSSSSSSVHQQQAVRDRLPGPDWRVLDTPHDTGGMNTDTPSQATPSGGSSSSSSFSFSLSSVPKALLTGTMEILDSYFPSSFSRSASPPGPRLVPDRDKDTHRDKDRERDRDRDRDNESSCNPIPPPHPPPPRRFRSFHTELHGNSNILLHSHIRCLVDHFPTAIQHDAWELLYSTELHGSDLASFYSRSGACAYSLLVVRTMDGQVFGGFATEAWRMTRHGREVFYGSGQSFLYRCHPSAPGEEEEDCPDNDNVDVFGWKYDNYFFQWSNPRQIAMGGGGVCLCVYPPLAPLLILSSLMSFHHPHALAVVCSGSIFFMYTPSLCLCTLPLLFSLTDSLPPSLTH